MPFDPTQPFETVDEQTEAPAPDVPAAAPAGFSLSGVLDNAYQAAKEVSGQFVHSLLTPGGIAEMATPVVGTVKELIRTPEILKEAIEKAKTGETFGQFAEVDKTPAFSKERFATGFGTVIQLLMAKGAAKGAAKIQAEMAKEFPKTESITETVKPEEVKPNAEQVTETAQPNVDVLNPEGTKTGEGTLPADVSSEGVQARGQGAKVQEGEPVPGAAPSGSEPAVEFTTKKDPISGETFSAVLKAPDGTPVGEGIGDITGNKLTIRNLGIDDPAFKGKGHGVQMYEQIIAEADKRGLSVESGKSVTQDAANVYGALEKRGYEVTKNPKAVTEPDGTLTTGRGEGSVFTVKPKPVEVAPEYVPAEGEFPALKKTSTQNAVMDQERVARGAPPILRDAIKEQPKVWEEAAAELETNPNRGAEIAREAIANPDAEIAPKSEAILLRHKVEVDNRLRTNMEKSLDQNLPEGERLTAQTEASRALEDLDVVDQATAARGRAWGQFGKFRQAMANDDYSLGSMLLKKKAAKGGEAVTPEEAATITAQNKRLNTLQENIDVREAKLLEANKKRVATLTEKLKGRISEKDFEKRVRKQITDPELDKMRFEYSKVREEFNRGVFNDQLARRTTAQKTFGRIGETINTARAVVTGLDLSAVLRQGGFVALSHPIRAVKAMPAMFRALKSERGQFDVMREIQNRENAALYKRDKLYISETGEAQPLSKMEEAFMSRWAGKIPGVAASQRAYITFLDRLRADSFDAMAKGLSRDGKLNPAEGKAIAEFINIATGRGSLGVTLSNASPALNTVFFAPRYVASRFQLLAGKPLWKGTAATRKMIAGEYARFLAGAGVVYGLAKAAGAELEVDPRSSDFAKIKFGNTRIDPMSGLAQATTFLAREVTGQSKQQGKIKPIRGDDVKYGSDTSANVMGRFLRSKLSPSVGAAVDVAVGENVVGEKVTPGKAALRMITPLSPSDIVDAMKEQGIPRGAAMGLLALFGMGLQSYKPRKKSGKGAPGRERNA